MSGHAMSLGYTGGGVDDVVSKHKHSHTRRIARCSSALNTPGVGPGFVIPLQSNLRIFARTHRDVRDRPPGSLLSRARAPPRAPLSLTDEKKKATTTLLRAVTVVAVNTAGTPVSFYLVFPGHRSREPSDIPASEANCNPLLQAHFRGCHIKNKYSKSLSVSPA
jgi:hypothetical protein